MLRLALILIVLAGCGKGQPPLSGPVGLRFQFEGTWTADDRVYVEQFVEQLGGTGYYNDLAAVGAAPEFHVVPDGKYSVRMVHDSTLDGCAWHGDDGVIVVAPKCAVWDHSWITRALSHELVELAADPGVDDNDRELADPCSLDPLMLTVAGRSVLVSRYSINGRCVPRP